MKASCRSKYDLLLNCPETDSKRVRQYLFIGLEDTCHINTFRTWMFSVVLKLFASVYWHQLLHSCFVIDASFISCSATGWPVTSSHICTGVEIGLYNPTLLTDYSADTWMPTSFSVAAPSTSLTWIVDLTILLRCVPVCLLSRDWFLLQNLWSFERSLKEQSNFHQI